MVKIPIVHAMGDKMLRNSGCVLLLALATFLVNVEEALPKQEVSNFHCSPLFTKLALSIQNHMENYGSIKIHCKSKDDDMGEHILRYDQYTRFLFRPYPLGGNTFFWCDVFWNDKWVVLDAYVQENDWYRCYHNHCKCQWAITSKGPCFWDNETKQYSICESWRKM